MNTRLKSTAILMVLILTLSIFTSLAATTAVAAATTSPTVEAAKTAVATATPTVAESRTPAAAATATTLTITASNTNPPVGQTVTFTVTLKASSIGLSKPVKIWHSWPGGARAEDGTHNTVNGVYSFVQKFGSKGQRVYHAEFAGDSRYGASSGTVTVNVRPIPTTTTMTASKTSPLVNEQIKITVTLKAGSTVLSKPVKIWHTASGVRYEDGIHNTVNGVYSFNQAFGSKGQRVYHAEFAATGTYGASSGTLTVNVQPIPTTTTITASKTNPTVNEWFMLTVTLKAGSTPLSRPVKIWVTEPDGKDYVYGAGTTKTNAQGVFLFSQNWLTTKGQYVYHVQFAGDSQYAASTGAVTVTVQKIPTKITDMKATYASDQAGGGPRMIVTGKLTDINGNPITYGPYSVAVLLTSGNPNQGQIGVTTSADGTFATAMAIAQPPNHWYQATFLGDDTYSGVSTIIWQAPP